MGRDAGVSFPDPDGAPPGISTLRGRMRAGCAHGDEAGPTRSQENSPGSGRSRSIEWPDRPSIRPDENPIFLKHSLDTGIDREFNAYPLIPSGQQNVAIVPTRQNPPAPR
jgi:hypothetical protein